MLLLSFNMKQHPQNQHQPTPTNQPTNQPTNKFGCNQGQNLQNHQSVSIRCFLVLLSGKNVHLRHLDLSEARIFFIVVRNIELRVDFCLAFGSCLVGSVVYLFLDGRFKDGFWSLIWNIFLIWWILFLCCLGLNMFFSVSKLLLLSTLFCVQRMFVAVKGFPIWGSHFPDRRSKHWLALFIF